MAALCFCALFAVYLCHSEAAPFAGEESLLNRHCMGSVGIPLPLCGIGMPKHKLYLLQPLYVDNSRNSPNA